MPTMCRHCVTNYKYPMNQEESLLSRNFQVMGDTDTSKRMGVQSVLCIENK